MGVFARLFLYRHGILPTHTLHRPVISVGNLTTGGSGKTPMVDYLASLLTTRGRQVSILSRGYRGHFSGKHLVVCRGNGPLVSPVECGDEPFLLGKNHPGSVVVVGPDRYRCGRIAEDLLPNCVHILDDGFQHLRLARQSNILLVEANDPFGGNRLLPAGHLREPRSALRRATMVCITHADPQRRYHSLIGEIRRYHSQVPILLSWNESIGMMTAGKTGICPMEEFRGAAAGAFAGIARPDLFFGQLRQSGVDIRWQKTYPDHHSYTPEDLRQIRIHSTRAGADILITTQKDEVKVSCLGEPDMPLWFLKIAVCFEDYGPLTDMLKDLEGQ